MLPRIPTFLPIFLATSSIVKFEANCEKHEWDNLNEALRKKLEAVIYHLNRVNNPDDASRLGDQANVIVNEFLLEHPEEIEAIVTESCRPQWY